MANNKIDAAKTKIEFSKIKMIAENVSSCLEN